MLVIHPIIMCGGGGTRLWPVSRQALPKQMLKLAASEPLIAQTVRRFASQRYDSDIKMATVVACCGAQHQRMLQQALSAAGLPRVKVISEPSGRNTAAAVAVAASYVRETFPDNDTHVLVIVPSDHRIDDDLAFGKSVLRAARCAASQQMLVTIGVVPRSPHSGYGYIHPGEPLPQSDGTGYRITRFIEKPESAKASQLIEQHHALWNSGIFVGTCELFIEELQAHAPQILGLASQALAGAEVRGDEHVLHEAAWSQIEPVSFDYAVLEKSARLAVIVADFGWSDLGSWDSVRDITPRDGAGNATQGDAVVVNSRNCYVSSDGAILPVICGVSDLAVVVTADALLVAGIDDAQSVRAAVEVLKQQERAQWLEPAKVARPWGTYEVIDRGQGYQVKRIEVAPGGRLSLQYHHHRSEHWCVVQGEAEVTVGDEVSHLRAGESVDIPLGAVHRLANNGVTKAVLIEVQRGDILEESDIVRLEDIYQRV